MESKVSIVPSVIIDIDKLIEHGFEAYFNNSIKQMKMYERMTQDLLHLLENNIDMSVEDYIAVSKDIGAIRRKRRLHKNEIALLEANKGDCEAFIRFIVTAREFSNKVDNYVYKTRVMKEVVGETLIASENNQLLKSLKEKAELTDDIINRLLCLEKFTLKQVRKNKREKKELVAVDMLKNNWKKLFENLEETLKNIIIKEAEDIYDKRANSVAVPEIKEFVVWSDIIPTLLYYRNMFLK